MESGAKNRLQDLAIKGLAVARVAVSASALLNLLKQASSDTTHKGWGKMLGYFDHAGQTLEVRETYGLLLPKNDERMRKEDLIDETIKKNLNLFSGNHRQVGFFIYSEDNDVFTYSILNYIINNDKFGPAKVFLHFSVSRARLGKNPFTFYRVSDKLNALLFSQRIENDKTYYELNEDPMLGFDLQKDSLFQEVPFEVVQSPVFKRFLGRHPESFEQGEGKAERAKFSENVTQNLNECIHKHAAHLQNFIQNKKTQKKASLVNLFGSFERVRKTLAEKRELVGEIDEKMSEIEQRLG